MADRTVGAKKDTTKVYNIRGGWESDQVLHPDAEAYLRTLMKGLTFEDKFYSVLDIGSGHGGFTTRLAGISENLLVTDFMQEHVDHTLDRLEKEHPKGNFAGQQLDVSSDLIPQLSAQGN